MTALFDPAGHDRIDIYSSRALDRVCRFKRSRCRS